MLSKKMHWEVEAERETTREMEMELMLNTRHVQEGSSLTGVLTNRHSCGKQGHSATSGDSTMPYAMGTGHPSKDPGLDGTVRLGVSQ